MQKTMQKTSFKRSLRDIVSYKLIRHESSKQICTGACGAIFLTFSFLVSYIAIILTLRGASQAGFIFQYSPWGLHIDFSIPPLPSMENRTHDTYGFPKIAAVCEAIFREEESLAKLFSLYASPKYAITSSKEDNGETPNHHFSMKWWHSLSALPESELPPPLLEEYWPLVKPTNGAQFGPNLSASQQFCLSLMEVRDKLRVFKYSPPWSLWQIGGVMAFNRALLVEEYILHHSSKGIFRAKKQEDATAFLLPLSAYSYTQLTFNRGGKLEVGQAAFSKLVQHIQANYPESWQRHNACDHVYVTTHDKGTGYARQEAVLVDRSLAITNTAEDPDLRNDPAAINIAPFNWRKDVSTVPSISFRLPSYAARLEVFSRRSLSSRRFLFNFIGRAESHPVRREVFAAFGNSTLHPDVVLREGKTSTREYMELMGRSRYCLHMRGTRAQSPRLIEMMYFGCVPIILADRYYWPLHGVVDWSKFALIVPESDAHRVKELAIGDLPNLATRQEWLRRVVPLFLYHAAPIFGDAFHVTMLLTKKHIETNLQRPECLPDAVDNDPPMFAPSSIASSDRISPPASAVVDFNEKAVVVAAAHGASADTQGGTVRVGGRRAFQIKAAAAA